MKRSSVIEERRKHVSPEIRRSVDLSFQIADRIHEILKAKGMKQKELAAALGKSEAEISKWMRGIHNFTIDTLISIEKAVGAPIIIVAHQECMQADFEPMLTSESAVK
uniref:HTH cro/C1-type domain-containing protein n=2 Tax=unclassified Prevotella TaxID=2638335 RepID=A0AB33JIK8_9BACT